MPTARTDQPLRIALAIESSGPGGAENMVLQLAEALRQVGHAVWIATLRAGWMTERAEALGIPVRVFRQRAGLDPRWMLGFAAWLRSERIRVLHTHEFAMGAFGGAAALAVRIPRIAIHGRHYLTERRRRVLAYRILRRTGMTLVAVSHDLADFLASGLGIRRDRIAVIHNGISLPEEAACEAGEAARRAARRKARLPSSGPLLLAVGNLYPVKDHATLLHAAAGLGDVQVAIAGRGDEQERLLGVAAELGLRDRFHLLGLRDDVETLLRAADVFVQPSRSEGLPLAVLEAMAVGLPVVASRVGGIPEAIRNGETGLLVPPSQPAALAEALRKLLESPERRLELARAARRRVREAFSVEAMRERYLKLYAGRSPE